MIKFLENYVNFHSIISSASSELVLLFFFAQWCKPCQRLYQNFLDYDMEKKKEGKDLLILKIDLEKFPQFFQDKKYRITAIPTLFLIDKNFNILKENVGYLDIISIKRLLN